MKKEKIQEKIWDYKSQFKISLFGFVFSILTFLVTVIPIVAYAVIQTQTGGILGDFYEHYNSLWSLIFAILQLKGEYLISPMFIVIIAIIIFAISIFGMFMTQYKLHDIKDHLKPEEWKEMKRKKREVKEYHSFQEWLDG